VGYRLPVGIEHCDFPNAHGSLVSSPARPLNSSSPAGQQKTLARVAQHHENAFGDKQVIGPQNAFVNGRIDESRAEPVNGPFAISSTASEYSWKRSCNGRRTHRSCKLRPTNSSDQTLIARVAPQHAWELVLDCHRHQTDQLILVCVAMALIETSPQT